MGKSISYTEENIRSLDWREHIRLRPGMYIGKLGDGSSPDDGIYILLKEIKQHQDISIANHKAAKSAPDSLAKAEEILKTITPLI